MVCFFVIQFRVESLDRIENRIVFFLVFQNGNSFFLFAFHFVFKRILSKVLAISVQNLCMWTIHFLRNSFFLFIQTRINKMLNRFVSLSKKAKFKPNEEEQQFNFCVNKYN